MIISKMVCQYRGFQYLTTVTLKVKQHVELILTLVDPCPFRVRYTVSDMLVS